MDGHTVSVGNLTHLEDQGIDPGSLTRLADELRQEGQTVVFVAVDRRAAGLLGVADPIKPTSREAIDALHGERVQIVMLTGDNRATAEVVARALSIDRVEAEVLPDQKAEVVRQLQRSGRRVAMAGDGINDAPALAQADVGIAMGSGTDVAMESAGVTLVKGDLRGIVRARRLSRATMRNIRQNLFFAFFYNVLGVPIAAGVLYPFTGILLSPVLASAAMTFSSVSVIANALRLRRVPLVAVRAGLQARLISDEFYGPEVQIEILGLESEAAGHLSHGSFEAHQRETDRLHFGGGQGLLLHAADGLALHQLAQELHDGQHELSDRLLHVLWFGVPPRGRALRPAS